MRQNYFAVIVAPKVPAPALMPRKCEDEKTRSGRDGKERKTRRGLSKREVTGRRQGEARVLRQEAVIALLT